MNVQSQSSSLATSSSSSSSSLTIKSLTWNVENLKKNKFALKDFVDLVSPDFIFLNETQTFQFEANTATDIFLSKYSYYLNSDDSFDQELPYIRNRSHGGTMVLWKKSLDQYVTLIPPISSSFLPILYHPCGSPPSLQIALYLPTAGREMEFIEEISKLRQFLEEFLEFKSDHAVFIRGDSNVNFNNKTRLNIFNEFLNSFNLSSIPMYHNTYHHFLGDGLFDSSIDVILCTNHFGLEKLENIFCKHDNHIIDSHHDVILSSFLLPYSPVPVPTILAEAPVIPNKRTKIIWNNESLLDYQNIVGNNLEKLRKRWFCPSSKSCTSMLLQATTEILLSASIATNKSVSLSSSVQAKPQKIPHSIKKSMNRIKRKFRICKSLHKNDPNSTQAASLLKKAKCEHRRLVRSLAHKQNMKEDEKMFSLMSSESSSSIFRKIRHIKSSSLTKIPFIEVANEKYEGEAVKDGFYSSIKTLKSKEKSLDNATNNILLEDYKHILDLCKDKRDLLPISIEESSKILKKMKASVIDFYSISPAHFINAGKAGLEHFNLLMNCIIEDINNASIEEMNSCYALLIHKGHGKLRTKDSSYRTISTCPVAPKAIDLYIRDLYKHRWASQEAPTQYQGEGSSHELAALLITEVVQYSLFSLKEPAYLLFLDAKSAFDKVRPELLIRNLYLAGMNGSSINLINNRLTNRLTFLDWNRSIMGPIKDELGLEQGGPSSSDYYKLYSNENLVNAQKSRQGINIPNSGVISAVGLADDTILAANKLSKLNNILFLTTNYCQKYGVTLSHEKTKLLKISNIKHTDVNHEVYNPICIDGHPISFSKEAEHVGVIRSSERGNLPHLLNRISSHRKAMGSTLSSGIAQKSRANPVVGLRLEKVYGLPVLCSGVSMLFLSGSEISLIEKHLKCTYQNIQKLLPDTPRSVIHFLSGSLPGEAVIHLRMLGIFGMVARLTGDPLQIHARNILTTAKSSLKSWFIQIRNICLKYDLPHPLIILDTQPDKKTYTKLINSKVISYWEKRLRGEAALLSSLIYFKPEFMSLKDPHPIWSTAGSNPYEISKAIQQARFLSGRYRTESLTKHWSMNREGFCQSPTCNSVVETVEHILIHCRAYTSCKKSLYSLWVSTPNPIVLGLVLEALSSETAYLLQFILDCSVLPTVINATQKYGFMILEELFYLTRTWCFSVHKQRLMMLGRWKY